MKNTDTGYQAMLSQLQNARARTDEIFALIRPEALYERPIPERHRLAFYLGHMEAFDWNLICAGSFGMDSPQQEFDRLFAFGIDPTNGSLPLDQPGDWPRETEIRQYNARVRKAVDGCLKSASDNYLFHVAVEHRLMHAETLAYLLHWLPFSLKSPEPVFSHVLSTSVAPRQVEIPGGVATLGMPKDEESFGWDNEFDAHPVDVQAFSIDAYKVTNAQYREFVDAGGYQERSFWDDSAWEWITRAGIQHPHFWKRNGDDWQCRTMFADIAFQSSWPVYVSHAEAEAYTRWTRTSLPTEEQFHRAAYGTPDGSERLYPWGNTSPKRQHGNFNFEHWNPTAVDAYPEGDSAFGGAGLVGNGWEWTSTKFSPFPGFEKFDFYPGYSADFFDGKHYVMKGGSARTASVLLRRSFRNWFQPAYPNIYASFRCVQN